MKAMAWKKPLDFDVSALTGMTRGHWQEAAAVLLKGVMAHASAGKARIKLGGALSINGQDSDEMEGFCRSMIMAASWLNGAAAQKSALDLEGLDVAGFYRQGLIAGTDPSHPEYWGPVLDYSQKIVECAALAWSLFLARDVIWQGLTPNERNQIGDYLLQCNYTKVWDNNWRLFKVVINAALKRLDMPFSQEEIDQNLERCLQMYIGEGWYGDGPGHQIDYYTAWGFHYYSLAWMIMDGQSDPHRSDLVVERLRSWMKSFRYFFATEGSVPFFGRSALYRFAYLGPIALGAYSGCFEQDLSELKTMCNATLKFFLDHNIFREDGVLVPGYLREFKALPESYSCPGSAYWAAKAFHVLMMPESHDFWQKQEQPLAAHGERFSIPVEPAGLLILGGGDSGHVQLINQKSFHDDPSVNVSYSRFCCSSLFQQEVGNSPDNAGKGYVMCDNALVFSRGQRWLRRWRIHKTTCSDNIISAEYPIVEIIKKTGQWLPRWEVSWGKIRTTIVVKDDFMVNIHHVRCWVPLRFKEGGYPLGVDQCQKRCQKRCQARKSARHLYEPRVISRQGTQAVYAGDRVSFIRHLYGYDRLCPEEFFSGRNMRYQRSIVPAVMTRKKLRGLFFLASVVCARVGNDPFDQLAGLVKHFEIAEGRAVITFYDDDKVQVSVKFSNKD